MQLTDLVRKLTPFFWLRTEAPTAGDEKVKVSADDTTTDYLISKLAAGTGISIAEINPGGNEDAQITCTLNGVPSGAIILWDNSDSCPAGYTEIGSAANRIILIVAAGPGGTGGTTTHYHTLVTYDTVYNKGSGITVGLHQTAGGQFMGYAGAGAYTVIRKYGYTDSKSHLYSYYECVICEKN